MARERPPAISALNGYTSPANWTSTAPHSSSARYATLAPPPRVLVLDLRALRFMDSSGVHVIVNAAIRARRGKRRLLVVCGPPQVNRRLTLSGASEVLEIVELHPHEPFPPIRLARADEAA